MTGAEGAAGEGHQEAFNAGEMILHHVMDGQTMELPFVGEVHLPTLHVGALDLPITRHVVMMWVACAILFLLLWLANRGRRLAPTGIHNAMEMVVAFVRDELARKNIGPHGDRFVPYLLTTFAFILICNLIGLVPWGATATSNMSVTAALAGVAFITIQGSGIAAYGLVGHFRNLVPHGLPWWLVPMMAALEMLGNLIKPIALAVRLFANMIAGHVVLLALISLVFILKKAWVGAVLTVPFSLFICALEIFVAFLQAYIFTMLTSLFIGMSVHPEH